MRTLKIFLYYFFLVSFLFSCKKEEDSFAIHVSGKVIDGNTNLPVANSIVEIYKLKNSENIRFNSMTTDSLGYYSITVSSDDNASLAAYNSNYVYSYQNENVIPKEKNIENFNIKIFPVVYLDISIKFVDTSYNYMQVASRQNKYSYPHVYLSKPSDTLKHLILYKKGGINNTFSIDVAKSNSFNFSNAPRVYYNYTVYCNPTDTTFYSLQY